MHLRQLILEIREAIKSGRYTNEAAVKQGIVTPILRALGWPDNETQRVSPEHPVEGGRVDFALCHPASKPVVFIEVKAVGQAEGADRQLLWYAFKDGVPMAVLTDGQVWHFYLPLEGGNYQERRFYQLDLLGRDIDECVKRFEAYLDSDAVCSRRALETARKDYQGKKRIDVIKQTLPQAWKQVLEEQDESLLELFADQVERSCGYRPDIETLSAFLLSMESPPVPTSRREPDRSERRPRAAMSDLPFIGLRLNDRDFQASSKKDVLIGVFEKLADRDPTFLKRFAARPVHGRFRRYLADDKYTLYPNNRERCEESSHEVRRGWWLSTHWGGIAIQKIIRMACEVAGIVYGQDLVINLGPPG